MHVIVRCGFCLVLGSLSACSTRGSEDRGPGQDSGTKPAPAVPASRAIVVRVALASEKSVSAEVELSGSLAAMADAAIAAQVEGTISALRLDLGDRVRRNTLLARIDPREYRLRLAQTQAQKLHAEANLQRVERLASMEAVTPQDLDDARAKAAQARAEYELARKKFSDTEVRAPFAGAVAKRQVSPGEYVRVGQPLFQIVAMDPLKLSGEVPERYHSQLRVGDVVSSEVGALTGRTFEGKISRVSPVVNAQSRSFTVEAQIDNPHELLKPGMFARLNVRFAGQRKVTVVPEAALSAFAGVLKVFVVDGGVTLEKRVQVEQHLEGEVAVTGEVKPGDWVAVTSVGRLADGMQVDARKDQRSLDSQASARGLPAATVAPTVRE